jgi:hypothetical protein
MKPKPTPVLPSRSALNALGKSPRSINDYAKAVPPAGTAVSPVVQLMRKQPLK